ncbi:hypothetical protein Phage2-1_00089 [Achromobacter phage 2-1]|nr:hypothetical protein Phage2-1_00089 [Achromobacter phage 2-1]
MSLHTLPYYKARAGSICDALTRPSPEQRNTVPWAASVVIGGRRTNGFRAAVLMACVVGALVERGHPDLAEALIKELASYAEFEGAAKPVDSE